MTIKLLVVGKTDKKELRELISEYEKRLGFYSKYQTEVIPDPKKSRKLDENQQKTAEGQAILFRLQPSDFVILLDEQGKEYSSVGFSQFIQKRLNSGLKQLVFVIGGPYGFSPEVYDRADSKLSLSRLTFSHQMVRLFFTEQLYRAFTILKNEPYHH